MNNNNIYNRETTIQNKTTQDSTLSNLVCPCGTHFQNIQGLSKHRRTCKVFLDQTSDNNNFTQGNRYVCYYQKIFKIFVLNY